MEHFFRGHKHPGCKNGKQVVMDLKADIVRRTPVHVYAIDQGWMAKKQNQANGSGRTPSLAHLMQKQHKATTEYAEYA